MEKKPVFGVDRLAFAPITTDSAENITYGTVVEWKKALIRAALTPNNASGSLEASDQTVDQYVMKMGGSLEIVTTALVPEDDVLLFGDKKDTATGVITTSGDDIVPEVMCIYSTRRSDGTMNLYKVHKTKFSPPTETGETATVGNRPYQTISLQGNYVNTLFDGRSVSKLRGLDVSTPEGQQKYDAWFASATGGLPTVE